MSRLWFSIRVCYLSTVFQDDLEYMDDNADKLGRKKMRMDAMKRQFAINGSYLFHFTVYRWFHH